jgi:hypothetical protein
MSRKDKDSMRCKVVVAIRRRKVALDNWRERHKRHLAAVDHYISHPNSEQAEAHVHDMGVVEEKMLRLAGEIDMFQRCLEKMT